MFNPDSVRPADYRRFERAVPDWYRAAKLGIFVHWGPYSVPAWAEPFGELGTHDVDRQWFRHHPYAEWYGNTIRIPGSPAQLHHQKVYAGRPYEEFLDEWDAARFEPDELLALFARTGAGYLIPTTKHHDGVTLWDAPGAGELSTVRRGPRQDLIGRFAESARAAGLRFGVYYSGGLDWSFADFPPIEDGIEPDDDTHRPVDPAYAAYAYAHVKDLIDRYAPDVLWGDIDWPDAGKPAGPLSLVSLFEHFYRTVPDGVVNDRWGETHWDFRTSEYQEGGSVEREAMWENTRGIGYSFGYNQCEDERHTMNGPAAVRHFVDVVSRGGNLLLNVGLKADGTVPELQRRTLSHLADWNQLNGFAVFGTTSLNESVARPSDRPWTRWTRSATRAHAFVEADGAVVLPVTPGSLDAASAMAADGSRVKAHESAEGMLVELPAAGVTGPTLVSFELRS